jgi:hypothetical protein
MDRRYTRHCHHCSKVDDAPITKPTHQVGSSNYITTKIWHENEANTKDKILSGMFCCCDEHSHHHDGSNNDDAGVEQLKQEPPDLLEEGDKAVN